jgi:uncharacterized membrane protein
VSPTRLVRARLLRSLRRYLMAGLLIWLPVIATILVVRFIVQLMDQLLLVLPTQLRPDTLLGFHIPGFGVLMAVVVLLLTGLLVTNFIGRTLVGLWEEVLHRIPFVRAIYGGVKSFSETILSNSGNSFKKVLLVQYPRTGIWSLGFQTNADLPEISHRTGAEQICVFVPTTPNPTSGFIMMLPRAEIIELDMTVDAAMKMIVTLGVVMPPAAPAAAAGHGRG